MVGAGYTCDRGLLTLRSTVWAARPTATGDLRHRRRSPSNSKVTSTLSEAASKALLAAHGVPVAPERLVRTPDAAAAAATALGYPVVAKLCGAGIAHKTERGLVRLALRDEASVRDATRALLALA